MAKGTVFTSSIGGTSYQFVTNAETTISPSEGVYKFSSVPIFEGTLTTFKYTVDSAILTKNLLYQNVNVDLSTLKVSIQNSSSDTTTQVYTKATGIVGLTSTSKVYFLQESDEGKFEIYFGDGIIGKSLDDGNIVILEYVVTNKTAVLSGAIGGFFKRLNYFTTSNVKVVNNK